MACFPEIEIGKQERADDRPKRRGGLIVARRGVCRRRVVTPPGSTDTYMVVLRKERDMTGNLFSKRIGML
jgi:hypothetical protein